MSKNFDSQARAFSFLFCALVSLASLPLLGWHYWQTLHGFAVLALFGLLGVDLVLWFASYWSTSASTAALKVAALVVKIALAGVMLLNAGAVLYIMRSDQQAAEATAQASASTVAEVAARAAAARAAGSDPWGSAGRPRDRPHVSDCPLPRSSRPPRSCPAGISTSGSTLCPRSPPARFLRADDLRLDRPAVGKPVSSAQRSSRVACTVERSRPVASSALDRADRPPSLAPPVAVPSKPRSTGRRARRSMPPPERSGSGRVPLPDIPGIQWEWNLRGGRMLA
jgi:hypothetical protein